MPKTGFYPSRKLASRGNKYVAELNLWPLVGLLIVLVVLFVILAVPPVLVHTVLP